MTPFDPFEENANAPFPTDDLAFSADELDWLTAEAERLATEATETATAEAMPAEPTAEVATATADVPLAAEQPTPDAPAVEEVSIPASAPRILRTSPNAQRTEHLYGWQVRNTTPKVMPQVVVRHELPTNTKCVGVSHGGKLDGQCLVWKLGDLAPEANINLRVKVVPIDPSVPFSAEVGDFRISYVWQNRIRHPEVTALFDGPTTVACGATHEWHLCLRNSGNGPTKALAVTIDPGASFAPTSHAPLTFDLEPLNPSDEVTISVSLKALHAGEATLSAHVSEWPEVITHRVQVTAPVLQLTLQSDPTWYLDTTNEATLIVTNSGTAAATDVIVQWDLPEGLEFLGTDSALEYEHEQHRLTGLWIQLDAGRTLRFPVRLRGLVPGDGRHRASVLAVPQLSAHVEQACAVEFDPGRPSTAMAELLAELDTATPRPSAVRTGSQGPTMARGLLTEQQIIFAVQGTRYAVPVTAVVEVGPVPPLTPIPNVPSWLHGVANVRGDILAIVELQSFLTGIPSNATERRLVVLKANQGTELVVGLLVDHVVGIRPKAEAIQPLPSTSSENPIHQYARGLATWDEELVVLLDPSHLLFSPAMRRPLGAETE